MRHICRSRGSAGGGHWSRSRSIGMGLLPVDVGPRHCGCGLQLRRSFSAGAWAAHALLEGRLAGNNLFGPLAQFHRYTCRTVPRARSRRRSPRQYLHKSLCICLFSRLLRYLKSSYSCDGDGLLQPGLQDNSNTLHHSTCLTPAPELARSGWKRV